MYESYNYNNRAPVTVHGADRVDDSVPLVEESGVAHGRVEVPVIEQVVLVALVTGRFGGFMR